MNYLFPSYVGCMYLTINIVREQEQFVIIIYYMMSMAMESLCTVCPIIFYHG